MGRVVRPHGLNGRVVVEMTSNRAERTAQGSRLVWSGGDVEVATASPLPQVGGRDRWLVSFKGVEDLQTAEAMRGTVLRAQALDAQGELWAHEVIGAEVVEADGTKVGVVAALQAGVASDLLVLEDGKLIPLSFVTSSRDGWLTVELPSGLLDL